MTSIFKISSLLAILLVAAGLAHVVRADENAVSYTVSPTIYDMTANPGQVFRSTLRIINANKFALHLYIDAQDFVPKGEDGIPQFLPINKSAGDQSTLAQWIGAETEITIQPEQTYELPFTVTVPPDAAPGGHYAALMIGTKPPKNSTNANDVYTAQTISALVFTRITGDISEQSSVRSFRTTNYLLGKPEAVFELRIENRGNVHVQPQGEIKIYNMWGQERGVIPVNQQALFGNVLPNSVRKFAFEWKSEWSITDIGRYTAVATLAYGVDSRQFMTADTAFWIIPWKFLLLIFSVLGAFVALMTWAIKLYVRHMLRLAGVRPKNEVVVTVPEEVEISAKIGGKKKTGVGTVKSKRYAAPLEEGILDLRDSLKGKRTILDKLAAVFAYIKRYWKFFFVAVSIFAFLIMLTLFIKGAMTPKREYEVRMIQPGETNSAPTVNTEPTKQNSDTDTQVPEVSTTTVATSAPTDSATTTPE